MGSFSAIGVDDDLAAGETGVAMGTADDELPRGIDMVCNVVVEEGEHFLAPDFRLHPWHEDMDDIVLDGIKFETNKTKEMTSLLKNLGVADNKVILVVTELDENLCYASRNLGNVKVVLPEEVNTYDALNCDNMVITADALKHLEEVLTNE